MKTKDKKALINAVEKWVGTFNAVKTEMLAVVMAAESDDWEEIKKPDDNEENEIFNDELPSWGFMWQFGNEEDNRWLEKRWLNLEDWEESNGVYAMLDCGFRVFYSKKFGYFFGIDGAGYDFYENHWIPLYKARGLMWHLN